MAKRSKSSDRWLRRQRRDPFAQQAKESGQVSRAHYKLEELDRRFKILSPGHRVLEMGAAPGGWTAYIEDRIKDGQLIVCDDRPVTHGAHTLWVEGRYGEAEVDQRIDELCRDEPLHVVLSDMAPNMSGIRVADQARAMELAEFAEEAALKYLQPGGALVVKVFNGAGVDAWLAQLRRHFLKVRLIKPKASRAESREVYAVALQFDGVS